MQQEPTSPDDGHSEVTSFTYSTSGGLNQSSTASGKRDISQFVKYLLEGSGVDETSVDLASLRRELERIEREKAENRVTQQQLPTEGSGNGYPLAQQQQQRPSSKIDMGSASDLALDAQSVSLQQFFDNTQQQQQQQQQNIAQASTVDNSHPTKDFTINRLHNSMDQLADELLRFQKSPANTAVSAASTAPLDFSSLESLSRLLVESGFPPLPPQSIPTDLGSLSQQQRLSTALYRALEMVAQEYTVKVQLIQSLTAKANTVLEQSSELTDRYEKMLAERDGRLASVERLRETDRLQFQRMQSSMDAGHSQQQQLSDALSAATDENELLKRERHGLQVECESLQSKLVQLEDRLAARERADQQAKQRAQELIVRLTSSAAAAVGQKPPVVLREVQELVAYYEEKMATNAAAPSVPTAAAVVCTASATEEQGQQLIVQDELVAEIKELRNELEQTCETISAMQEENELLKLKLLSAQAIGGTTESTKKDRKRMTTQELIRFDKQQAKLRSFAIDSMPADECRHMIREICRTLNIDGVKELVRSLQSIAKAISLIPQMERFIETVDAIVWAPSKLLYQFLDGAQIAHESAAPHKLSETVTTLKEWRQLVEQDVKQLRSFRQSVADALNLSHAGDRQTEQELQRRCLQELKRLLGANMSSADYNAQQPQQSTRAPSSLGEDALGNLLDLFNIEDRGRAQAVVNELFLFVTETNRWLAKLRTLLDQPSLATTSNNRSSAPFAAVSPENPLSLEPPSKTLGRLWQALASSRVAESVPNDGSSVPRSSPASGLRKTVGSETDITMSSLDALLGKVSQVEADWQREIHSKSTTTILLKPGEDQRSYQNRWVVSSEDDAEQSAGDETN